jgi:sulfatase maturation enzyme AslB (radical SAM superfamily)
MARALFDLGVRRYQVTLDGPSAFHDQTRVRRDGGGSFDRIWSNLIDIRDSDLAVGIWLRVHVTAANLSAMADSSPGYDRNFSAIPGLVRSFAGFEADFACELGG